MLSKIRFSVVDVETTGLNAKKEEIVSIAIIPMIGTRILAGDHYYRFVRPKKLKAGSIKIHGIDIKPLKNAKTFREISGELNEILRDTIFVGCSTGFDVEILKRHFSRINIKIKPDWVDIIQVERWLSERGGVRGDFTTLEQLMARYGLEDVCRHSALADAYQAAQIFQFQLKKLMGFKVGMKDLLSIGRRREEFVPLGMG
ncbi:MAG: 3'-5' exonuclease [Candidatus Altiarchaeota archaeon]|nr:3'-5' exonuclease [Candidatus Altiarchaeota archaeon]